MGDHPAEADDLLTLDPDAYRLLLRPLLFRLPPETAQALADFVLQREWLWRAVSPALRLRNPRLKTHLAGIELENPVGLAAGYDKDCRFLPSMAALGFGYVTGGTVTEAPRDGNSRPRVLRVVRERGLINALGFPGKGLDATSRRLQHSRRSARTPRVISVSGTTADEIVRCHHRLEPFAAAIEINISSPNTAGLRVFQEADALSDLLGRVNDERRKPLFVKMPPYADPDSGVASEAESRDNVLGLVRACVSEGVEALTISNTRPVEDARLAVGAGGLSGKPIFEDMLRMVREVKGEVGDRAAINACGGIFTGYDAWEALRAGATTVQLLTGLIYRGPGIVKRINRELLKQMDRAGVERL